MAEPHEDDDAVSQALNQAQPEAVSGAKPTRRTAKRRGKDKGKRKRAIRLPSDPRDISSLTIPVNADGVIRHPDGTLAPGTAPLNGSSMQAWNGAREKLRAALVRSVSERDVEEVAAALLVKAKKGDVFAAREILDRTVGRVQDSSATQLPQIFLNLVVSGQAQVAVSSGVSDPLSDNSPYVPPLDVPGVVLRERSEASAQHESERSGESEPELD